MDDAAVLADAEFLAAVNSPVYTCPSSPGLNEIVEQKPSEDEISRVSPSLDHAKSVNVARCRLLTTHMGVICCVS